MANIQRKKGSITSVRHISPVIKTKLFSSAHVSPRRAEAPLINNTWDNKVRVWVQSRRGRAREREREKWWVSADKQQWCRTTFAGGCGAMAGEKEVIR